MILDRAKAVGGPGTLIIVGMAVVLAVALWAYGVSGRAAADEPQSAQAPPGATTSAARTSTGGQVTLKATWQGAAEGPVFDIVMDTHSVNLDGVDLQQLAVLRVDEGPELKPLKWDAPKGGHHRTGTLTFPAGRPDGSPVIGPQARVVQLVIRKVAGVPERVLEWQQ